MGATYGRALQAIVRPVFSEVPHKLLSENFNLVCPEFGEGMASLLQLGARKANAGPGTWQRCFISGHPPSKEPPACRE